MLRRLLPLVAVVLVVSLGAGCADAGAPAARIGDSIEISNDDLLAEVGAWAGSPALLESLQLGDPEGAAPGSYATSFVNSVLGFQINFALHQQQFEVLGLELTDEQLAEVRSGILGDQSAAVLDELGPEHADQLVEDAARQFAVSEAMGDGYQAWAVEVLTTVDVEVNPRYGSWDAQSGSVVPPEGPRPAPTTGPSVGL